MNSAFLPPLALPFKQSPSPAVSQRRPNNLTRATVAAPNPPTMPGDAPWMPLPDVVHDIRTPEQFDVLREAARRDGKLLVADFMASWCRKCLYLVPRLNKLAKEELGVYYCKVDVNKVHRLPKEFAIEKMPTFVFLGDTEERLVGGGKPEVVAKQLRESIDRLAKRGD